MKGHRITLLGSQERALRDWLCGHPEGHERGAIVLFRRLARSVQHQEASDRFLAVDIINMNGDWIIESSVTHLQIDMRKMPEVYLRCEREGLELGFVHNHTTTIRTFSSQDEVNEKNILHGISACNGSKSYLVAMLLCDGRWSARIRQGSIPDEVLPVRHICVMGEQMRVFGVTIPEESPENLKRQEAAFGKPFNAILQSLRVAVVGVGGTGSEIAILLARAGIGELILTDHDVLDKSNLNRVRGYRFDDVGMNKAQSLAKFIESLGLEVSVSAIPGKVDESGEAIDALSSADIILGCTDDQSGRNIMNQAMYYYGQAYIDLGLSGRVDIDTEGNPYLREHCGRISCILPEYGACLRCQRVVTDELLAYEQAIKDRPELLALDPAVLKREYYLVGGGEQAPGVGPFTSATADVAVATLMNLLKPYRQISTDLRPDNIWIDFVHMDMHSNEPSDNPSCIYCRTHSLIHKREGKYRLEMPRLGEIPAND